MATAEMTDDYDFYSAQLASLNRSRFHGNFSQYLYDNGSAYDDHYIDVDLFEKYDKNRAVSDVAYYALIFAYSLLIVIGTIGNLLVMIAISFNKRMRTARNIFIATLAVADSTLCLFTMPMTLLGILTKYWPFGPNAWILCKLVRTSPAVTVFFSSYTMALIAVDRHRFIVHSTKRQVTPCEAVCISMGVFVFSVLISTPFTVYTKLTKIFDEPGAYDHISFCLEDLPQSGQALMAGGVFVLQYLFPCTIVSVSYIYVCHYLGNRPIMTSDARQRLLEAKRRRNNRMLIMVAVTHFLSWLPLNVANVVIYSLDTEEKPLFGNLEHMLITYAICHLASMSSAITNPILYGYMNENFRQEFGKIWSRTVAFFGCSSAINNNGPVQLLSLDQIGTVNAERDKRNSVLGEEANV